jgi:hypothetical protein
MSARWSLTVSPAKTASHVVSAVNTGKVPLDLKVTTGEVVKVKGHCTLTNYSPPWATLTAHHAHLGPGDRVKVHVHVKHPPKHPTDLAVVFSTVPGHHGVSVSGSVASQVAVGGHPACLALPASQSHPTPSWVLVLVIVLLALAGAGMGALVSLKRRGERSDGSL